MEAADSFPNNVLPHDEVEFPVTPDPKTSPKRDEPMRRSEFMVTKTKIDRGVTIPSHSAQFIRENQTLSGFFKFGSAKATQNQYESKKLQSKSVMIEENMAEGQLDQSHRYISLQKQHFSSILLDSEDSARQNDGLPAPHEKILNPRVPASSQDLDICVLDSVDWIPKKKPVLEIVGLQGSVNQKFFEAYQRTLFSYKIALNEIALMQTELVKLRNLASKPDFCGCSERKVTETNHKQQMKLTEIGKRKKSIENPCNDGLGPFKKIKTTTISELDFRSEPDKAFRLNGHPATESGHPTHHIPALFAPVASRRVPTQAPPPPAKSSTHTNNTNNNNNTNINNNNTNINNNNININNNNINNTNNNNNNKLAEQYRRQFSGSGRPWDGPDTHSRERPTRTGTGVLVRGPGGQTGAGWVEGGVGRVVGGGGVCEGKEGERGAKAGVGVVRDDGVKEKEGGVSRTDLDGEKERGLIAEAPEPQTVLTSKVDYADSIKVKMSPNRLLTIISLSDSEDEDPIKLHELMPPNLQVGEQTPVNTDLKDKTKVSESDSPAEQTIHNPNVRESSDTGQVEENTFIQTSGINAIFAKYSGSSLQMNAKVPAPPLSATLFFPDTNYS